jgi:hypothetical protein
VVGKVFMGVPLPNNTPPIIAARPGSLLYSVLTFYFVLSNTMANSIFGILNLWPVGGMAVTYALWCFSMPHGRLPSRWA